MANQPNPRPIQRTPIRPPSRPQDRRSGRRPIRPTGITGSWWRFKGPTLAFIATIALAACGGTGASTAPSGAASTAPSAAASAPASSPPASASAAPSASGAAAQELAVTGTDYAFQAPASIPAGLTTVTLTNSGAEEHQAQIAGLKAGATMEQLTAALAANEVEALALLTLSGGPTGVQPADSGSTTSNLAPGQYVFLCFVRAADGVPHFAKGMVAPIEVTEPPVAGDPPAGDSAMTLQDFAFVGLDTLTAGPHAVTMTNVGPQPHEATIVKLADGVEVGDLPAMFASTEPPSGPPPFTSVGGVAGIDVGATVVVDVDLEAGNYAFLCFVPDPATGAPHAALGMIGALTVN